MLSSVVRSGASSGSVSDLSFIVLRGSRETRLTVYALVKYGNSLRRLRMISGDVQAKLDGFYAYGLQDLGTSFNPATVGAADLAHEELEALCTALATNDWGFITLL
ncbi:unnamed protein product [Polarella glacialis]|uniref:Uncharacterized protein n=2 Tax=Polarella glacialis TaxID=89957 RepID=A0A813EA09_POLGL|nr:unnamed protein product [Polarella glacialis]CAE8597175.1 unnamed protein product [Polarella glacialis]